MCSQGRKSKAKTLFCVVTAEVPGTDNVGPNSAMPAPISIISMKAETMSTREQTRVTEKEVEISGLAKLELGKNTCARRKSIWS